MLAFVQKIFKIYDVLSNENSFLSVKWINEVMYLCSQVQSRTEKGNLHNNFQCQVI